MSSKELIALGMRLHLVQKLTSKWLYALDQCVSNMVSDVCPPERHKHEPKQMRAGVYVYAAGSIAAGILDLIWGDFEAAHQPIQALGDHIPGREILAYIAAIWLVAGGAAILWRRTARAGAWALAAIYFIFAVFWLPRFYTAPHVLGFRIPVLIGLLAGVAQQFILVAAAAIVYASLADARLGMAVESTLSSFVGHSDSPQSSSVWRT